MQQRSRIRLQANVKYREHMMTDGGNSDHLPETIQAGEPGNILKSFHVVGHEKIQSCQMAEPVQLPQIQAGVTLNCQCRDMFWQILQQTVQVVESYDRYGLGMLHTVPQLLNLLLLFFVCTQFQTYQTAIQCLACMKQKASKQEW